MKVRSQSLPGVLTANAAPRKRRPNPLRTDPTRTGTLRRALKAELRRRMARLRAELRDLIVKEDVFGLRLSPTTFAGLVRDPGLRPFTPTEPPAPTHFLTNTRWKLFSLAEKVRAFADWLKARLDDLVDGMTRVWQGYTERAYRQGVKRAYEDARARGHVPPAPNLPALPVGGGRDAAKDQFVSTTLRKPASAEALALLSSRADTAFKAVTDAVERNSLRQLSDLLLTESTPVSVADALTKTVDEIGLTRSAAVAHEAIVRPHAEGQLAGLEGLGYGETEAVVEYRTAGGRGKSGSKGGRVSKKGNPSPCPLCRPYAGQVMTLSQARGLIPRHPHCLCSWGPVSPTGTKVSNVFCPTGKGGGIDPTCTGGGAGSGGAGAGYAGKVNLSGIQDPDVLGRVETTLRDLSRDYGVRLNTVRTTIMPKNEWDEASAAQMVTTQSLRPGVGRFKDAKPGDIQTSLHLDLDAVVWRDKESLKAYLRKLPDGYLADRSAVGMIRHEFAHALEKLHPEDADLIGRVYTSYRRQGPTVSDYSSSAPKEMVAEAFSHYLRQGDLGGTGLEQLAPVFDRWKRSHPVQNFNPRQARDSVGRWAAGAGSAVVGKVSGAIAAGSGIEHAAKEFLRDGVGKVLAKLPAGLRAAVEASYYATRSGTKAAFITWTAGQALAERVAKERGLSEDKARLLRSTLAKVDLVAMKPISVALGATGVGAAGVGAASLIPPATAGYLAYSTARDPAATARAARGLVRDALKRLQGPSTPPKAPPTFRPTVEQIGNTYKKESPVGQVGNRRDDDPTARREAQTKALANANQLADLLAKHNYDDWFLALFSTALDETGDVHRAAQLASRLYREHPSTKIENVFCPTGKGGGIDPKCSTGKGESKGRTSAKLPKAVSVVSSPAPAGYARVVTLRPSATRAFNGVPTAAKTKLSKQETGRIGEAIVVAYLQGQGRTDAKPMNLDRNNFPVDLVQDHEVVEVKAGLASNSAGAQRWRLTIGEPGKAEKAALAAMGKAEKAAWNTEKQRKIHERKEGILRKLSKHFGTKIKAATMTVIINPDTKTADLYRFEGFHDRIGWTSGQAQAGYLGSVRYETNG